MAPLIVIAAAASFLGSLFLSRHAGAIAMRYGFVAVPDAVNRHGRDVPLLGGAAILAACLPALVYGAFGPAGQPGLLAAVAAVALLGLAKDRGRRVPIGLQLIVQLAAGALLGLGGPAWRLGLGSLADIACTALFVAATINAFNFLDVQDGLAAAIAALASAGFAISLFALGRAPEATLALTLAAACLGFLLLNRPPARIFMGDCGAFAIGLLLAALCMTAAQCGAAASPARGLLPLIVLLLELPATMLARAIRGRSPFHGDGLHVTTWLRRHGVPEAGVLAGCAALTLGGSLAALAARGVSC